MRKLLITVLVLGSFSAFAENQIDQILKKYVGSHDGYNNQTGKDCGV
jgi:hypothetical protein